MKIKQMANEIRQKMPKDLNELEILRYIYIYVGKNKNFDPQYFFGDKETKKKIYRLANEKIEDEEFLTSKKNLICVSIASTVRLLGKEFGIDIKITRNDATGHMYNTANLEDGRKILLDVQQDLGFIHASDRTNFFGKRWDTYDRLDTEIIENIDEKIGYKKKNKGYRKEQMQLIGKKLEGKSENDKIKELLLTDEFNEVLRETDGYVELRNFMEETLLDIKAYGSEVITCYRDENIYKEPLPERQFSMCILTKENNIYMFKQKEKNFVQISVGRMKRLIDQGLNFKVTMGNAYAINILQEILRNYDNTTER